MTPQELNPLLDPAIVAKDFFTYSAVFTGLTAGVTQQKNIAISDDSDFIVLKTTFFADDGVGSKFTPNTRLIPNVLILLTDTGSGRQLMDAPQPLYNLFGTAENPFIYPVPKQLKRRTVLQIAATNQENAAATWRFTLSFIGVKVFK